MHTESVGPPSMFYQLVYLLTIAFIGAVSGYMCNGTDSSVSAPEVTLSELDSGCDHDRKSRDPACVSAMNQYCSKVTFSSPIETFGVSRDAGDERINLACVESSWTGDVPLGELMILDGSCNARKSQEEKCLSAAHKYCKNRFGEDYGGIIQTVTDGTFEVHCFESTRVEDVRHDVLRSFNAGCHYLTSHSDHCFAAASMFCSEYFQSDGGITQESNSQTITVACYRANFTGDAFIIRNNDFYASLSEAETVCDLDFDIKSGLIIEDSPDVLKSQVYDNRNSTLPLDGSFSLSTSVSESSTFTVSNQFSISFTATFSFGKPMVLGGSLSLNTAFTTTMTSSTTTTESRTFTQSSSVSVPPGKMVMKQAVVSISTLDVPYTATVRTRLGTTKTVQGTWLGTSTHSFRITQEDINKI